MMVYYVGFLAFPSLLCCKNVGFDFWEGLASGLDWPVGCMWSVDATFSDWRVGTTKVHQVMENSKRPS